VSNEETGMTEGLIDSNFLLPERTTDAMTAAFRSGEAIIELRAVLASTGTSSANRSSAASFRC